MQVSYCLAPVFFSDRDVEPGLGKVDHLVVDRGLDLGFLELRFQRLVLFLELVDQFAWGLLRLARLARDVFFHAGNLSFFFLVDSDPPSRSSVADWQKARDALAAEAFLVVEADHLAKIQLLFLRL